MEVHVARNVIIQSRPNFGQIFDDKILSVFLSVTISPRIRTLLVFWSVVGWMVGWPDCHNFLKGGKLHLF